MGYVFVLMKDEVFVVKYRSDFVTNSSSSSFIIAYNSPTDMVNDIRQFVEKYEDNGWSHQYKDIVYFLFKYKITYTEALKKLKEILDEQAYWKLANLSEYKEKYGSYSAWVESSEFKKMRKKYVQEGLNKFKNSVNPRGHFVYLYLHDGDGYYDVEAHLQDMLKGVYIKNVLH